MSTHTDVGVCPLFVLFFVPYAANICNLKPLFPCASLLLAAATAACGARDSDTKQSGVDPSSTPLQHHNSLSERLQTRSALFSFVSAESSSVRCDLFLLPSALLEGESSCV